MALDDDDLGFTMTPDFLQRASRAIRWYERTGGGGSPERPPPSPKSDLIAVVTGAPLAVPTTSLPPPSVATTVPAPFAKAVWPAKLVRRRFREQANDRWWVPEAGRCWVQEIGGRPVWIGRQYPAVRIGELNGVSVVGVNAAESATPLAVVSAVPELTIAGVDYWAAVALMWDQSAGDLTDDVPFGNDVLVFDPLGGGFAYGDTIFGTLGPPVLPRPSSGGYYPQQAVSSFMKIAAGSVGTGSDDYVAGAPKAQGPVYPYVTDGASSDCFYDFNLVTGKNPDGTFNTGEAVWLTPIYKPEIYIWDSVAGTGWSPGSTFDLRTSSSSIHKAHYAGYSYNPSGHGSRRVFWTSEIGFAFAVDCNGTVPQTINVG